MPAASDGSATKEGKKDKKESKEKKKETSSGDAGGKKTNGKSGGAPAANEPMAPVPSMIDLRVGHIVDGAASCSLVLVMLTLPRPIAQFTSTLMLTDSMSRYALHLVSSPGDHD